MVTSNMIVVMLLYYVKTSSELDIMCVSDGTFGPNRLVVRTTRCGRVDPGSNPGSDMCIV